MINNNRHCKGTHFLIKMQIKMKNNKGNLYKSVFESASLRDANLYLLDIPHTASVGLLRVCLFKAIYRSVLNSKPKTARRRGGGF